MADAPRPPVPLAVACGLGAAVVGLAAAELTSALSPRLRSPVLDVGDRVIDQVPAALKNLAIDWFGTGDKAALLVGIAAVLALYAGAVGLVWVRYRRRGLGLAGLALFGLLGSVAATAGRVDRPWWAATPSLVGTVAAVGVLAAATRALGPAAGAEEQGPDAVEATVVTLAGDRRQFLIGLGAVTLVGAGVLASGGRLRSRFSAAASRAGVRLPGARRPLGPVPGGVQAEGAVPFFTPNDRFYRIDTALTVPQVPVESWSLRVHGLVDRELRVSYDELLTRPVVEADITLSCVSNEVGGNLLGTARWLGVRLDDLLAEAGIAPSADQIVGRSVDGYTCGFPVSALDGRDALVAVAMNGEPLPLEHGFPARLIVPGLYGYVSATKWLSEIELTTFDAFDQYWVPRGWDAQAPIKTQSRIDTPRGLARVAAGPVPVAGVAWAQTRGIDRVEVSVDGGPWREATLAAEVNDTTWRQWRYLWDAAAAGPGRHTVTVRATDRTGAIQTPDRSEPMPNGATGQHQIIVLVDEAA